MPKPVCVNCNCFFQKIKMGVNVEETFSTNGCDLEPYKIWHADLYACPKCGFEVVTDYGNCPIMEHFEDDFKKQYEGLEKPIIKANTVS